MLEWRFPVILTISILLLFINVGAPRAPFKISQTSSFIYNHLERMRGIQNKEDFALTRAFILGDKRSLTKKLKTRFTGLHTNHLFTPSGIHFSSFLILFLPFLKKLRRRGNRKISFVLELIICLLPFGLSQFYSLKRISVLRISNLIFKYLNFKLDFFYIFSISFFLDFIFGTYSSSPMSFTFSFLFLGSLLSTARFSSIALSFLSANLILTLFLHIEVSLIGFFLGFLLTSIFSLIFPFVFISYWVSSFVLIDLTHPFLYIVKNLAHFFYNLSKYSPLLEIDLVGLFFILIYSSNRKLRFLIFSIILSSSRIYNIPTDRVKQRVSNSSPLHKVWRIDKGIERSRSDSQSCRRKILMRGHQIRCREIKRR